MLYVIKKTCYNPDGSFYEDELVCNGPYESKDEAYEAALKLAEDELRLLNGEDGGDTPDEGVSFGIVEDEDKNSIRVNYYYLESDADTTGNTEPVTIYTICTIFEDDYEIYKGCWIITYHKMVFGKRTRMYMVEQFDTDLYKSSNFKKCIEFCDDWNKIFEGGKL